MPNIKLVATVARAELSFFDGYAMFFRGEWSETTEGGSF